MGDRVGDQCLFVETEEKDGDLHSSNGAFLEKLWGALCVIVWIKNKDLSLLCLRAPLLFTHGADVDKLQIDRIMFDIHDITILRSCITFTAIIGAFNARDMGKCGVELGEGVNKYLIPLRRLLLEINLQNQSSFRILLLIPTVLTDPHQLIVLLIEVEIESACGTEIRRFHNWFYYTLRVLPASILYVGTSDPQRLVESPTRGAVQGPRKN